MSEPVSERFSTRSQIAVIWWAIAFTLIYGMAFLFLVQMVPPPDATLGPNEVADFYRDKEEEIRVGATIGGWTSAFMLPLWCVIGIQMYRVERGRPIWTILAVAGGAMMSIFLVLPFLFWGVAAFTPTRNPEVTTLMHELGVLTLTSTDQYYIFNWVAVVVICLSPQLNVAHSPFTRWYGYFTAWTGFMFEAGAVVFLPRTGPFAWDGVLVFWSPLTLFTAWIVVTCYVLLKSLRAQLRDEAAKPAAPEPAPA